MARCGVGLDLSNELEIEFELVNDPDLESMLQGKLELGVRLALGRKLELGSCGQRVLGSDFRWFDR